MINRGIQIHHSADYTTVKRLDVELFPGDPRIPSTDHSWIVSDATGRAVGFATGKVWTPDNYFYFTRCGVLPEARGLGLQRRLIKTRTTYARKLGCKGIYTYTLPFNTASSNNLIGCGFRLWRPAYKWAGAECLYWAKEIDK